MKIILPNNSILELVKKQIDNLFFLSIDEEEVLLNSIPKSLDRLEYCFSHYSSKKKYVIKNGEPIFNVLYSDAYATFLYFLSNTIYREFKQMELATKIYYLNKVLHSIDLYFEVELPLIFSLGHPIGTVLGRAKYSNYFGVMQNCTVGNNHGVYPVFGEGVSLLAGSMVIGKCNIGNNCIIAAKTFIKDQDIPDNSIVFGATPDLIIKPNSNKAIGTVFIKNDN